MRLGATAPQHPLDGQARWPYRLTKRLLGEAHLGGLVVRLNPLTRALLLSLTFLLLFFISVDSALAWQVTLPDFSNSSMARGLAIDAERNIITADWWSNRFVVTKLSGGTGEVLWRKTISGTGIVSGGGLSVAVASDGSVVAGGNLTVGSPGFYRTAFAVVKLDGATGVEQWRFLINSTDGGASEVAFDDHGDVVVAGYVRFSSYAFFVIKLSGLNGSELWRRSDPGVGGTSRAETLAIDPAGDVIAGGYIANDSRNTAFLVEKLSGATGALVWVFRNDTSGIDISNAAGSLALDGRGDVLATGRVTNASTREDAFVVKLSGGGGDELWRTTIDSGLGDFDAATSVAVDGSGDAVIAGTFTNGQRSEFFVIKLAGESGTEKWRRIVKGSADFADFGFAVTVDAGNDVVAAGKTQSLATNADWTAVKLQGSTGQEMWRTDLSGTAANSENDFALSVATDGCADVVVAGMTQNTSTTFDYTVLKLSGTTGLSRDTFSDGPCAEPPSAPPSAAFATQAVVECTGPSGGVVTLDGSGSTDDDSTPGTNDDIQSFEWFEDYGQATQRSLGEGAQLEVTLALGAHVIGLKVTDSAGLSDVAQQTVTVQDTVPPTLTLALGPKVLSPPNHRMVSVQATWQAFDVCDPAATVKLVSVTSSEPDDAPGSGDGNTTGDIQDAAIDTPDASVLLRAERSADGPGRVYTLLYTATDASGNPASSSGQVTVLHDPGRTPLASSARTLQGTTRKKPAVPAPDPLPLP